MNTFLLYYFIIFMPFLTASEEEPKITIFQNPNKILPSNIPDRFKHWTEIYGDNIYTAFGNIYKNETEKNKQEALKKKIVATIEEEMRPTLTNLFNNAFIISAEDKKTTLESLLQKIPVYNGDGALSKLHYNQEAYESFRKSINPQYPYTAADQETKFLLSSPIVFPAALTPCWSWNTDTKKLQDEDAIGIIFCNGVNFESNKTADYKKFIKNETELKNRIEIITQCIVKAANKLTKDAKKTTCNLKIPKIGLGQFAKNYPDNKKTLLTDFYLKSISQALKEQVTADRNISWNVEFFNFDNNNNYTKSYNYIFVDQNKENQKFTLNGNNISMFKKSKQNHDNSLTVIAHCGDQHALLGNRCYNDESAEQYLAGFNNLDYLTPIHLLNLFLTEIAFDNEERNTLLRKEEKEEKKEEEIIPQNTFFSNINNHYFIGGGVVLVIFLTTLLIHYKTDFFKNLIDKFPHQIKGIFKI